MMRRKPIPLDYESREADPRSNAVRRQANDRTSVPSIGLVASIFLGFRGGKGVATGLGALLKIVPLAVLPAALVWLLVTISFRYVSLGSVLAASCVPLGALLLGMPAPFVIATFAVGAIIVGRHHANISRLLAGHEPKLGHRRSA